jgi:hypothetical protein
VQGQLLPWSPSALALLPAIARPLRQLFVVRHSSASIFAVLIVLRTQETVSLNDADDSHNPASRRPSPAKPSSVRPALSDEHSDRTEILRSILCIWRADLRFLTHGVYRPPADAPANQPGSNDSLSKVLLAMAGMMDEGHTPSLRAAAAKTLSELSRSEVEEVAKTRDGVFEFAA